MFTSAIKLNCPAKISNWGKKAKNSLIYKFANNSSPEDLLAEFWMGAHPSNPAYLEIDQQKISLRELIQKYPLEILGKQVATDFKAELPFLFKILSINTALSIQAHPNKALAAELRIANPTQYPDDNHKPEMGIALTDVELLYGFVKYEKLKENIQTVAEFKALLSALALEKLERKAENYLRTILSDVMSAKDEVIKLQCHKLYQRLSAKQTLSPEETWILKLKQDFPDGNVGIFGFYLLQYYKLKPEEAVFIGPNIAHAYLSGEVIECMACSDNVVRAGLTPKYQDVETLLKMLDYQVNSLNILKPEKSGAIYSYDTPASEFALSKIKLSADEVLLAKSYLPAIILCLSGSAELISASGVESVAEGEVYLLPFQMEKIRIKAEGSAEFYLAHLPK